MSGDIKTRAATRLDDAFGREAIIGFDHGGFRDLQGFSEAPDGRDLGARRQRARGYPLPDDLHDPLDQRAGFCLQECSVFHVY